MTWRHQFPIPFRNLYYLWLMQKHFDEKFLWNPGCRKKSCDGSLMAINLSLQEENHLRHMVCCVAQENGARANWVSILTGTTKSQFHASVAPWCLIQMAPNLQWIKTHGSVSFGPNGVSIYWQEQQSRDFHAYAAPWCLIEMAPYLQWRCPWLKGGHIQNLKKIPSAIPEIRAIKLLKKIHFSSFCTLCVNHYNSHMRVSIWLKFGTRIGGWKANASIKFGINPLNVQGVTSDLRIKQSQTSVKPTG